MNPFPFFAATRDHARPYFAGFATPFADRALIFATGFCCALWCVVGWVLL